MDESPTTSSLGPIARQWRLIVGIAAVATLVALLIGTTQPTRYKSSANLLSGANLTASPLGVAEDPVRSLDTLVRLSQTRDVLSVAARRAHTSVRTIARNTSVSADPNADILTISATAADPKTARIYAQALSEGFVAWEKEREAVVLRARLASLKAQLTQLARNPGVATSEAAVVRAQVVEAQAALKTNQPTVTIVGPATTPHSASAPRLWRNALLALLAGLIVGVAAAAASTRVQRRFGDVDDVAAAYDAPVLGTVPAAAAGDYGRREPVADAVRSIRSNLAVLFLKRTRTPVILVSSATAGEGAAPLAANLAQAFASGGASVLAISADLRTPQLHLGFAGMRENRAADSPGLPEVLAGTATLSEAIYRAPLRGTTDGATVGVLAGNGTSVDPGSLYGSPAMRDLLDEARQEFEVVIVAGPPLLDGAETLVLAAETDGLVLVTRLHALRQDDVRQAQQMLARAGITPLGIVEVRGDGTRAAPTTREVVAVRGAELLDRLHALVSRLRTPSRDRQAAE